MPTSTSSSEAAGPLGPWKRVWGVGLLAAVLMFVGLEAFWRSQGHDPGVISDLDLWSLQREKLEGAGRDAVALLGASRMQLGFLPDVFTEVQETGPVANLAAAGEGPFAALRDLAEDETFSGVVIMSLSARNVQPSRLNDQQVFVDHYRNDWGPGKKVDRVLSGALQSRLVLLRQHLRGRQLLDSLLAGELPEVNYISNRFDRRRVADYTKVDVGELADSRLEFIQEELRAEPPVDDETWSETVTLLSEQVDAIQGRGGRVVFVHLPMCGRFREFSEASFPRERYWDVMASSVAAVSLHDLDLEGLDSLVCPDESHLDLASAELFTRTLALELGERGVFD